MFVRIIRKRLVAMGVSSPLSRYFRAVTEFGSGTIAEKVRQTRFVQREDYYCLFGDGRVDHWDDELSERFRLVSLLFPPFRLVC